MKPTCELRKITPAWAKKMIERYEQKREDFNNRKVSRFTVDRYAEAMKDGDWKISNDCICFDPDGNLINGQHRLYACVKSDTPFECFVISDLPRECFEVMDVGKKRSTADALSFIGEKNVYVLSASLTMTERYMTGKLGTGENLKPNNHDIQILLEKYPEIRLSTEFGQKRWRVIFTSSAVPVALHFLFAKKDPGLADKFMEDVASGQNLQGGSPIYLLREKLIMNTLSKAKLPTDFLMALTIKAWNAVRRGQTMRSLQFQDKENFPIIV